eukprot:TRINITY_DN1347_c0_g1_i1.p1 TRINITY_DN1347_c0_g1~~TRINITY_DN1347_c0_g1_i1.p1  ORF type:complete len:581 (+),score=106.27 TRINITY_DN1347_c0_g1_i1:51-1745(+)
MGCCGAKDNQDSEDGAAASTATSKKPTFNKPNARNTEDADSDGVQMNEQAANEGGGQPSFKALPYEAAVIDPPTAVTQEDREFNFEETDYVYVRPKGRRNERIITILLLGETGSGKSTLVNALFNHALGVQYNDRKRYRVIKETPPSDESVSQTQTVQVYRVWCEELKATIRIVDTPGFGDTRGIERDAEISDLVKNAIEREDEIHAVGFVAAASRPRLTHTQQYIVSKVLGCFGKDAINGIYILATFADGKRAPVLDAFKADSSFPFSEDRHFHFNNSALYATGTDRTEFTAGFWSMGASSMKKFFASLSTKTPFKLHTTVDVIQTQRRLESYVKGVLPQVTIGISKVTNLTQIMDDIDEKKAMINETGYYKYLSSIPKVERVPKEAGTYTTQCLKCSFSCHEECTRTDREKHLCCVMDAAGCCTVCPGRCSFIEHKNMDYIFVWKTEVVERECDMKKLANTAAQKGLTIAEALQADVTSDMHEACGNIRELLVKINSATRSLNELALRPTELSLKDYLTLLASEEQTAKHPGWEYRVIIINGILDNQAPPPRFAELVSLMKP